MSYTTTVSVSVAGSEKERGGRVGVRGWGGDKTKTLIMLVVAFAHTDGELHDHCICILRDFPFSCLTMWYLQCLECDDDRLRGNRSVLLSLQETE